ncbi:hypothetical protein BDV95DRAFT_311417 [Massariosphaeria phaeospora]|uniref:Uncharacterized protein n=1 Tax=Massariosphaeria phaeospora TaxID=100035 RepID=A0A7C8MUE3_9PLEO|nr:hypothetical protein BDV95DRAFT_311417 [Massariosphaeria phaeospora]
MGAFGELQLAYKYGSLLVLTILAGVVKVLFDRRKLKKFTKQQHVETGPTEDQVELNQREKDEGDLFGIRAIEAGFYAGIPQSRPTSRAGSYIESPSMSSNTLIGSALNSPKVNTHPMASSVTSLPLAHDSGRDSDTLPTQTASRRVSPPAIRLAPSVAEINGRHDINAGVNMRLNVPPSPVTRQPTSPRFGGSDSESDGQITPPSLSPRTANFKPDHYAPTAPQIPMPARAYRDEESDNTYLAYSEPRTRAGQSNDVNPEQPSSSYRLQPRIYQPTHQRDTSNASSVYSDKRKSQHYEPNNPSISYDYPFPEVSNGNSASLAANKEASAPASISSTLHPPGSSTSEQTHDSRLSEFYEAYYRHSQYANVLSSDASMRPTIANATQPTIVEVPSPLPSPKPQPGMAM